MGEAKLKEHQVADVQDRLDRVAAENVVLRQERDRLLVLLRWLSPKLIVRNANGIATRKFCLLDPICRQRRERCRHDEIWTLMDEATAATRQN